MTDAGLWKAAIIHLVDVRIVERGKLVQLECRRAWFIPRRIVVFGVRIRALNEI
jgi:hypothetical protein